MSPAHWLHGRESRPSRGAVGEWMLAGVAAAATGLPGQQRSTKSQVGGERGRAENSFTSQLNLAPPPASPELCREGAPAAGV